LGAIETKSELAYFEQPPCIAAERSKSKVQNQEKKMDTITLKDGITIYYKDWGTGQPLFFGDTPKVNPTIHPTRKPLSYIVFLAFLCV
jgi:hypothetical protein